MKISHFPNFLPSNQDMVYPQLIEAITSTDELVVGDMEADVALIWSVLWFGKMSGNKKVWDHYRAQGKPVVVVEVGGLIRNGTWKLGINGVNRDADFALDVGVNPDRVKQLGVETKPWVFKEKEYILVCGQHAHSLQWEGMPDMNTYFKETVTEIRAHSDRPIVLRSHPRFRENLHFTVEDPQWFKDQGCEWNIAKKVQKTYDSFDLENQLNETFLTVSHSSNAGINSIIQGIPAIVSKHSLAHDMTSSYSERIFTKRREWLIDMCNIEYRADEISVAWDRIRQKL
tara:strand:- start:607 stop:1464 length:858 start_codon:yes stop_codon:yes gene_type:complete